MYRNTITIKNVGPIKDVRLELKKVNVFMGQQSSGKSTIAKIISFCNWVEKDIATNQSFDKYTQKESYFIDRLESFHNMKGYFSSESEIYFKSKTIEIQYRKEELSIAWVDQFSYKRSKISYIPADRNVVNLSGIERVELPDNYLRSFLFDWLNARKSYNNKSSFSLIDLGVGYYYSESNKENHVKGENEAYDILLSNASSGMQSIIPLLVLVDHLINNIYTDEQSQSFEFNEAIQKTADILISKLIIEPYYSKDILDTDERINAINEIGKKIRGGDEAIIKHAVQFATVRDQLFKTHSTKLIIEEPEQNLFPSTQKSLVYSLLESISKEDDHQLTLTTHSPYVLYAINNCIMASLVRDKLSEEELSKLKCIASTIESDSIAIYEMKNGSVNSIQGENGLIGSNYFDKKMEEVMDEFYLMLNHYDD